MNVVKNERGTWSLEGLTEIDVAVLGKLSSAELAHLVSELVRKAKERQVEV